MSVIKLKADSGADGKRMGIYLGFLQLMFTLLWTVHVIYLPKLAAGVGIAPTAVILILMLDQAIFTGAAGLFGAVAVIVAELAGDLSTLVIAQFVAGSAWGCMLMSAVSAALAIGKTGAEGKMTGARVFRTRACHICADGGGRGGLQKLPDYAPLLKWAPVACRSVAGCGLLVIAASKRAAPRRI